MTSALHKNGLNLKGREIARGAKISRHRWNHGGFDMRVMVFVMFGKG